MTSKWGDGWGYGVRGEEESWLLLVPRTKNQEILHKGLFEGTMVYAPGETASLQRCPLIKSSPLSLLSHKMGNSLLR